MKREREWWLALGATGASMTANPERMEEDPLQGKSDLYLILTIPNQPFS
jgi:hypothetical protein